MNQKGTRYCFLLLLLSLAFTLICSPSATAQITPNCSAGASYSSPSCLTYNGTTGQLPDFYSDPLTYTLNNNIPNGELFFNPLANSTVSGQFYRGEGASLIPPVSGINSDPLYTNSTVCSNMFANMTPLCNGTPVTGCYAPQMVSVQIGGNAATQSMNCCTNWKATVANGTTTWAMGSYGYCSAGNFSNLEAYLLDENVNYNMPTYGNTAGNGNPGQIEGQGVSYGTAQQCMGCHGHMNVQASDGPAYLLSGHKNALRKVIPGVPLADPDGNVYSGLAGAYYILGGWQGPPSAFTQAGPYGGLSIGDCARCHTTGWSPNPPNTPTGTSGLGGFGSQLATQTGLEPSITTIANATGAFSGGFTNGTNGYQNSTGVPTYSYTALPAGVLNTTPYSEFGPAGAVSASWYLNGVTCERCHYSNVGTLNSSQGQESAPSHGVPNPAYYNGTGSNRYGKDMAAAPGNGTVSNPFIAPQIENGTYASNYNFAPMATGMNSLLLCLQCHRSETNTGNGTVANITINWPIIVTGDSGSCADGSGSTYANCTTNGSTWNFAPTIYEPDGTQLLASPHAKYVGAPPVMNQQNSADQSFAAGPNGTISNSTNFLTINQSSTLPGTAGCTGCHDPHFTTVNSPNVPTNPSWGVLYSDNGMTKVNSPSGPQGEMPALVSSGANSHNCNDAQCHGNSMQTLNHSTGPGTPFPTGTAADFPGACFTCHMQGSSGVGQSHLFRINPTATYYTYPSAAQWYAGSKALLADPTAFVLYNGVTLANGTYSYLNGTVTSYGVPSPAMINSTATAAYVNGTYAPPANDVDIVCGQCHGGGGSTDSRGDTNAPYTNPYGITTTGAPYFQRPYLASIAANIHGTQTPPTQLTAPTFGTPAGSYPTTQHVTLSAQAGATICYTTDSSTPTASTAGTCDQNTYSGAITVASSETLMAIATEAGNYLNSPVAAATYTIAPPGPVAVPSFSVKAGTYNLKYVCSNPTYTTQATCVANGSTWALSTLTDVLSDVTTGATICFTVNGNIPTATVPGTCDATVVGESTYSTALSIATPETVMAMATELGHTNSSVISAFYNVVPPAPTFTPGSEAFYQKYVNTSWPSVTLAAATSANILYCTVAAGAPACTPGTAYTTPITASCVSGNPPCGVTVYANAEFSGGTSPSSSSRATYTINPGDPPGTPYAATPTLSPAPGTITWAKLPLSVTITDSSPNAVICYTLNGPVPQVNPTATPAAPACKTGLVYTGPIPVIGTQQTTTAGSESGTTVTLTFASNKFAAGSQMKCTGITPTGYNGTWTVATSTSTQVTFATASGLGPITTQGSCVDAVEGSFSIIRAVAGGAGYLQSEPIAAGEYIFR